MAISLKQYLLLLGGFWGFSCVFVSGVLTGNDVAQVLFNASVGCIVGGMLLKWLGVIIIDCYITQKREQAYAAMRAAEQEQAKKGDA